MAGALRRIVAVQDEHPAVIQAQAQIDAVARDLVLTGRIVEVCDEWGAEAAEPLLGIVAGPLHRPSWP